MDVLVEASHFTCDDVLEFPGHFPGWFFEILQISGGRFGFTQSSIRLPGLTIACCNHSRHCEIEETYEPPVVCFSFLLSADKPFRSDGVEMAKPHLILQRPQEDYAFVFGGPTRALNVQVSTSVLEKMGWKLSPNRHHEISSRNLDAFCRWCAGVMNQSGGKLSLAELLRIRGQTLQHLGRLLQEEGVLETSEAKSLDSHPSATKTVSRVRAALRALPYDQPLNVPGIAAELKLSERTLYREFKHWVGVGPARYFELMRLHALRGFLKGLEARDRTMAATARKFGFSNPGRMALRYNELFFELPSVTARGFGRESEKS